MWAIVISEKCEFMIVQRQRYATRETTRVGLNNNVHIYIIIHLDPYVYSFQSVLAGI